MALIIKAIIIMTYLIKKIKSLIRKHKKKQSSLINKLSDKQFIEYLTLILSSQKFQQPSKFFKSLSKGCVSAPKGNKKRNLLNFLWQNLEKNFLDHILITSLYGLSPLSIRACP